MLDAARPALYAIVDLPYAGGQGALEVYEVVSALARGGARAIQLRAKGGFDGAWADAGGEAWGRLGRAALEQDFLLVVNDDVQLACALARAWPKHGRLGLHLGQEDLTSAGASAVRAAAEAGLAVGISTHDLDQVRAAQALAPSYLGFGPVFDTATKLNPDPTVGLERLRRACGESSVPVVAIGGITQRRCAACVAAGAAAIASISALVKDSIPQIEQAASAMRAQIVGQ